MTLLALRIPVDMTTALLSHAYFEVSSTSKVALVLI